MSELFKALQKLEEQNSPEVPKAFSLSGGDKKSKNSPPYLKSLLLLVLLLVLTVVCLGFLWFAKDSFTSSSTVTKTSADIEKTLSVPIVDPVSVPAEKAFLPKPEPVLQASFSPAEQPLPPMEENTGHVKIKVETIDTLPHEVVPDIQREKVSIEQLVETSTDDAERKQSRNRQKKRILYQAEKMREQGDLPKALILYKKIWALGPNPDIANNLAAILIHSKQYEEAEEYLKQVISLAPDDEDLQFNLKIAQEGKEREKKLIDEL